MGRPDSSSMASELQLLPNENSISEEKMEWKTRGRKERYTVTNVLLVTSISTHPPTFHTPSNAHSDFFSRPTKNNNSN